MTAPPDHDELAMRARLRARIDGPTAPSQPRDGRDETCDTTATDTVPQPRSPARQAATGRRDTVTDRWWDGLYDDAHDDHHRTRRRPRAVPRIPDWRKGEVADLTPPQPEQPETSAAPVKPRPAPVEVEPDVEPKPNDEPEPDNEVEGEQRWDWSRLRYWPYARLVCGAATAILPVFGGQSAALTWGDVLYRARTEAGVGAAWIIAAVGLTVGAMWVHHRRSWLAWAGLTCAFIGTIAMASPFDLVTFMTGVTR